VSRLVLPLPVEAQSVDQDHLGRELALELGL
jgi:hypothetical protein